MSICTSGQDSRPSRPSRPPKTSKRGGSRKKGPVKKTRTIEYIKVPKHWFSEPLHHAMRTVVRPPTKKTRRKELVIDMHVPLPTFIDLMNPMDTGDMSGFEWVDETKTELKPTADKKTLQEYIYTIKKPELCDKFMRLQDRETPRRMRKEGGLVLCRRGLGCARLHLSAKAEARGERTDLLASVTGNIIVKCKVPKEERAMPHLQLKLKVSTLNKNGHIEWATLFADRTAAALRKQMEAHLRSMIQNSDYPTLSTTTAGVLTLQTTSVRPQPLALMPPTTTHATNDA